MNRFNKLRINMWFQAMKLQLYFLIKAYKHLKIPCINLSISSKSVQNNLRFQTKSRDKWPNSSNSITTHRQCLHRWFLVNTHKLSNPKSFSIKDSIRENNILKWVKTNSPMSCSRSECNSHQYRPKCPST